MTSARKRVAILISGRGSNMRALIEASRSPDFPAEVVGVISSRADATGLDFARRTGIATAVVSAADSPDRAAQEAQLNQLLDEFQVDIVCLAGWMRLLGADFVARWSGRMLNIHPSLLPLFKGLHPHRQALDAGVRIHGCTVHFVTDETDSGPIVAQAAIPVAVNDDEERLANRVLAAEHRLYPLALRLVAEGKVAMQDTHARFSPMGPASGEMLLSPSAAQADVDVEALARFTP